MVSQHPKSLNILCDQCGLPFSRSEQGRGGITRVNKDVEFHFCCYGCSFTHSLTGEKGEGGIASLFLIRLAFSAFLSMNIMMLSWALYGERLKWLGFEADNIPGLTMLLFVLSTPIMLFVGYPFFKNAVSEVRMFRLSMDSLIALGSFAAYGFSTYEVFTGGTRLYFDTGTMVIVLVTAGRYLEASAKVRTSSAVHSLLELRPNVACVVRGRQEEEVATNEVNVGELIKILPGERIPLDGVIVEGNSSANESFLTGESLPVVKEPGSKVFAATINGEGAIVVRTTAPDSDTLHAQFVRLMEHAQRTRSPMQQLVDRISYIFIPTVIGIAAVTFIAWAFFGTLTAALIHSLTVLVVSCPCALGIGTPLATAIAVARAAEEGILIRSTNILEKLATITAVVFDKTGTLTRGDLSVVGVHSLGLPEEELVSAAATIESSSEHLFGKAVVRYAFKKKIVLSESRNVQAVPGLGIKGEVYLENKWINVIAGNTRLFSDVHVDRELMEKDQKERSSIYIALDGKICGVIQISDTLRADAVASVDRLKEEGIEVSVLSGDSRAVVDGVGKAIGSRAVFGELMPDEKVKKVREAHDAGKRVLMVGDGINDAPALSTADVGVAFGNATDLTKENADVTIIGSKLMNIPWLIQLGRKTYRIIQWNLFWAFIYNIAGIALAAFGLLDPILAAVAMILSSAVIIVNSRRINKI